MSHATFLQFTSSRYARSVAQCVADVVQSDGEAADPVRIAFAEIQPSFLPQGKRGRVAGFAPFVIGAPDWSTELPLVEVRLFRANAMDHFAADGTGCRVTRLKEAVQGAQEELAERRERSVLLLKDLNRFGLAANTLPSRPLVAIEYLRHGRLVGWRLALKDGGERHEG